MTKNYSKYDYIYETDRLAKAQAAAEKMLSPWPKGVCLTVRHRQTNGNVYAYVYKREKDPDGNNFFAYQNEDDLAAETDLIRTFCSNQVLKKVKELKKTLYTDPRSYDPFEIQRLYEDFYSAFKELTPREFQPNTKQIKVWLSQNTPSTHFPEELKFPTTRGDKVRSKYEQSMANILYELNIPYLYERPKQINHKPYLPDFTLLDPQNGTSVYIEAFGLMENPDYCKKSIKKIHDYEAAGYIQGKDFFMVFDDPDSPFDPAAFRNLMKRRFF